MFFLFLLSTICSNLNDIVNGNIKCGISPFAGIDFDCHQLCIYTTTETISVVETAVVFEIDKTSNIFTETQTISFQHTVTVDDTRTITITGFDYYNSTITSFYQNPLSTKWVPCTSAFIKKSETISLIFSKRAPLQTPGLDLTETISYTVTVFEKTSYSILFQYSGVRNTITKTNTNIKGYINFRGDYVQ